MAPHLAVPIVVGVGEAKNKSLNVAIQPKDLMLQAILSAVQDADFLNPDQLRASIDSIDVVKSWTWDYADLPGLLGEGLGAQLKRGFVSGQGGHSPGLLFDQAARRVARGESKAAVVTGGEAQASLAACASAKQMPPPGWPVKPPGSVSLVEAGRLELPSARNRRISTDLDVGILHAIGLPSQIYPLYENAFRAARQQSQAENDSESSRLYAYFAKVAAENESSWNHGKPAATAEEIVRTTKRNRMICSPYRLLMNAFNTVNLAAACILTTTEYARQLGIPESNWIYALAGAGTADSNEFWLRPNYYSSPSIVRSIDTALELAGMVEDDIDAYDFYSCFPIVPKIASDHLGISSLDPPKPITLLGGLTFFGGAGNNYSMHALVAMTRHLRAGKGRHGLVLANGGTLTHQHAVVLSSSPRQDGTPYPDHDVLPEHITDEPVPVFERKAEGEAIVETYTVEYARSGEPLRAYVVGRLIASGHRFLANHAEEHTLADLSDADRCAEPIGRKGWANPRQTLAKLMRKEGGWRKVLKLSSESRVR